MNGGYEPERFVDQVRRDLICCICLCVLRDPRLCAAGEHRFCLNCITQSIANDRRCPECREHLTLDTLQRPQSFLRNFLSELKIKCVYIDRGCPEKVELGNLQNHANNCEYRPVSCENCRREIEPDITRISRRLDEVVDTQNLYRQEVNEVSNSYEDIRTLTNLIEEERKNEVIGNKRNYQNVHKRVKKMKTVVNQLKPASRKMENRILNVERKQNRIEKGFHEMKQAHEGINVKVNDIEGNYNVIKSQFARFEDLLGHLLQENNFNRNGSQDMDPTIPANIQDVIILGGWYDREGTLNTVENYNIVEKRSAMLPRLNHHRAELASCVYNNDVFVVGGFDGNDGTDTIEVLKIDQHPLQWIMFDGKLPFKLHSHDIIVYQGNLYIIGGYDWNEEKASNAIYEIALTPPYTAKLLTRMTGRRRYHRAELVNEKLFILGGTTTNYSKDALDSVVVYDLIESKFKKCPSLPQPVCDMSTVTWGDKIIVLGGQDRNYQALNDVIMYDTETGQSERLPSMVYRRSGCSAVIMNDVIVVFGGENEEQKYLNSVETFTIGGDGWKELPEMIEKRFFATAVVKPQN